eukprot:c25221_g1_i1 orf=177-3638(+)
MEHTEKRDDPASACRLRIVCLCQGAIEAICALGLQSCLVGRSHECNSPAPVLAVPCVTSSDTSLLPDLSPICNINYLNALDHYYNINWELLQELKPDLIFAQTPIRANNTPVPLQAPQLTDRKCRVVSLQSHTVEDIFQNVETVANCCGVKKEGAKLVSLLRAQWKSIKQKTPQWADGMPQVDVAFLSCVNPLIGASYWIPEIISCAGGVSVCGKAGCPRNSVTLGDLTQRDPDVVVYLSYRLHVGSLATELSWLVTNKEWKTLKAIKANRFFLIDANRFFIDSAPNVISSAELMTEILHGFGYGHEGKGFVRWQSCAIPQDMRDGNIPLQQMMFETKMPTLVGNKGASTNHIGVDKHEVLSSAAQDHPKYVTNVYEVKRPAILQKCDIDHRGAKAKPDVWDGGLGVVESKQDDVVDERSAAETTRCLQAKIIRQVTPDTVLQGEKTTSKDSDGTVIDLCENWQNPVTESLSCEWNKTRSAQRTVHPINSFFVHNQKEKMAATKLGQTQSLPNATSHALPKHSPLDRFASSVIYKQANSTQDGFFNQQLISKVWASTKSAAQMRNSSMPPMSKEKVFQKSNSLPISPGSPESKVSSTSIDAINVAHVLGNLPQKAASFSISRDDSKPLAEDILCLQPAKDSLYVSGGNCNRARATQVSTARRREGSISSERVLKRRSSYSVPSSPRLDVVLRKSRIVRDAVLKSLVDLQCIDCLLLSGGLASNILAEAVPLVHSKGFKLGFTVLAGPAATDRASAAVAAKCKGMEHVIIGEGEKGFAVFLLAKELTFIVETLKTFDPVQIRNLVPIAAALREAKSRGLEHVVTGDGLDELLSRDGIWLNDVQIIHLGISKVLSRSAVLLGEALGIKVVQPFLHSKLLGEFKALSRTRALGNETTEHGRAILREAFPEVSAACNIEKGFNEVDSGMFYVSDYFSSAISASVLESKAKSIYQKEKICIRDAEHLVYYRAFKRAFKGKVPKGMVRWASKPCSGCGYQLSWDMNWYCLVCGLIQQSQNNQSKQHKLEQSKVAHQRKLSNLKGGSESLTQSSNGGVSIENGAGWNGAKCEETREMGSVSMVGNAKSDDGHGSKRFASEEKHRKTSSHHDSEVGKTVATSAKGVQRPTQKPNKEKKPNYWALLGAGSAGLLLLLQLSRR